MADKKWDVIESLDGWSVRSKETGRERLFLPTFRDKGGLVLNHDILDLLVNLGDDELGSLAHRTMFKKYEEDEEEEDDGESF